MTITARTLAEATAGGRWDGDSRGSDDQPGPERDERASEDTPHPGRHAKSRDGVVPHRSGGTSPYGTGLRDPSATHASAVGDRLRETLRGNTDEYY